MTVYDEKLPSMCHAIKKENFLPLNEKQRRVFHNGDFQGWEYTNDDGHKGLEIFLCFFERRRVGQYLLTVGDVSTAKNLVAGIQRWIDEMEGKEQG